MKTTYIRELSVSYGKKKQTTETIKEPDHLASFVRSIVQENGKEHMVCVALDASNAPIAYSIICKGIANACTVHPREIFQFALLANACSIMIAHNHPSGKTEPSREDDDITLRLSKASQIMGIKLLDHVIVGDDGYYSYAYHGNSNLN